MRLHVIAALVSLLATAIASPVRVAPRAATFTYPSFANAEASGYRVKTSQLPLFNGIDVQDSWAGRVDPASTPGTGLFFWVSDMLYIEQPAGVGFSTGSNANLTGEVPLADAFYTFLQAFYGVFPELSQKSLYLSGESYAGFYLPYIGSRILSASSEEKAALPLSLQGMIINDGVYSDDVVSEQAPTARFAAANQATLKLNDTFVSQLMNSSKACGYETLLDSVAYPQPSGPIYLPHSSDQIYSSEALNAECDLFDLFYAAAADANPCFNVYRITDVCPTPSDIIQDGTYLNRADVQAALHVANSSTWNECSDDPFVHDQDVSPFTESILPGILSQLPVLLWHGQIDSILFTNGDLVTLQNMTWNGVQGFEKAPNTTLTLNNVTTGTWGSERNLTFVSVMNAGHMIPQDQPALALAVFTSFINTGGIGDGKLTSSSGSFLAGVLGSNSSTSTAKSPASASTASRVGGVLSGLVSAGVVAALLI